MNETSSKKNDDEGMDDADPSAQQIFLVEQTIRGMMMVNDTSSHEHEHEHVYKPESDHVEVETSLPRQAVDSLTSVASRTATDADSPSLASAWCFHPLHGHSFQSVHLLDLKSHASSWFQVCLVCQERFVQWQWPIISALSRSAVKLSEQQPRREKMNSKISLDSSSSLSSTSTTTDSSSMVQCKACGAVAHRACALHPHTTRSTTPHQSSNWTIPICPVNQERLLELQRQHPQQQQQQTPVHTSTCSTTAKRHDDEGTDTDTETETTAGMAGTVDAAPIITATVSDPNADPSLANTRILNSNSSSSSNADEQTEPKSVNPPPIRMPPPVNDKEDDTCGAPVMTPLTATPPHHPHPQHPFASISRALQENILARRARGMRRTTEQQQPPQDQPQCEQDDTANDQTPASFTTQASPHDETNQADAAMNAPSTSTLLTPPHPLLARGVVLAGGVVVVAAAGLVLAGPAAGVCALMGVAVGEAATAAATGGVLSMGVLVGSVAVVGGHHLAQNLRSEHHQRRVLTMGEEGTKRKVLLVRPQLPEMDPIWETICYQARRKASEAMLTTPSPTTVPMSTNTQSDTGITPTPSILNSLLFRKHHNDPHDVVLERYRRDADILHNTEEEVPTKDKILLLVSRMLNDKTSIPGFVYRYMIDAFLDRCQTSCCIVDDENASESVSSFTVTHKSPSTITSADGESSKCCESPVDSSNAPRVRRDDVHAVIRYVTAVLLEDRPGLGVTPELTELTATAVEGLVFGRLYDVVFEEIVLESTIMDESLLNKIREFENDDTGMDPRPVLQVSEGALEALRLLSTAHSAVDKLYFCVQFLERISDYYLTQGSAMMMMMCADSLLKLTCHHIVAARLPRINAEIMFVEEFARDEPLLRGRDGYALVTLQASLHYLNSSDCLKDLFADDEDLDGMESDDDDDETSGGEQR